MPFLDIEPAIKSASIRSRFRLVNLASQRARELNDAGANSVDAAEPLKYSKVTTSALSDIIDGAVTFEDVARSVEREK